MPPSGSPASNCDPAIVRACGKAVEELKEARLLIKAQADEIVALDNRIETEKQQAILLRDKIGLLDQQMAALEEKIAALESANGTLVSLKARLDERIAKLEQQKSAANKRTLLGILAGIGVGVLIAR